ncbi:MAG: xanthine phosphoribosyltransferase, partial [Bacillota bacterium]|nr:xanthine phosphoribosyltransferase [Bacillota bacterium]
MELLKQRILKDGAIKGESILKVDSFLNHQIDVNLLREIALEFHRRFGQKNITKVLTIESSGIAIGAFVADVFGVSLVFAKKRHSANLGDDVYTVPVASFTHGCTYDVTVAKEFLQEGDGLLIVDDFLARGCALRGLLE